MCDASQKNRWLFFLLQPLPLEYREKMSFSFAKLILYTYFFFSVTATVDFTFRSFKSVFVRSFTVYTF